jgi:hypothetical protein
MGVLSEAAADIKADLRIAGASDREVLWFSQVKNYGETLLAQLHLLDDNTDGQIAFTALCRNFDLSQAAVRGHAHSRFMLPKVAKFFDQKLERNMAGNLIKSEWFKEYDVAPIFSANDLLVISIDTAMKGAPSADYSVATVWLARGENAYLLDLWRERVDYPKLRRGVHRLREKHPNATLLIEDNRSGTSLIQDLRASNLAVIGINRRGRQTDTRRQDLGSV